MRTRRIFIEGHINRLFVKPIALFLTLSLFGQEVFAAAPWAPASGASFPKSEAALPENFTLPREFGEVVSFRWRGPAARAVILIQDAHSIVDAQSNIRKIVDYLQQKQGIRFIGLEGLEGRLDPTLFRAFPDPRQKEKILEEYLRRGELSGPELAAALNPEKGEYVGLEDWSLYETNYRAYQAAMQEKAGLRVFLDQKQRALRRRQKITYHRDQSEFQRLWRHFEQNKISLEKFWDRLEVFSRRYTVVFNPQKYSELQQLRKILKADPAVWDRTQMRAEYFFSRFLKNNGPHFSPSERRHLQGLFQALRTERLSVHDFCEEFSRYLQAAKAPIPVEPDFQKLLHFAPRLFKIKGSRLFRELQTWGEEIEARVFQKKKARHLRRAFKVQEHLSRLARLELSREEFQFQKPVFSSSPDLAKSRWGPARLFYETAVRREEAFYRRLQKIFRESGQKTVAAVAGGFHSEGLLEKFRRDGLSYVLIAPKIDSFSGGENYAPVMRGEISYRPFLRFGKTIHEAFVRHALEELRPSLSGGEIQRWRDGVIRELSAEGRLSQASAYTQWIDSLAEGPRSGISAEKIFPFLKKEMKRFKREFLKPTVAVALSPARIALRSPQRNPKWIPESFLFQRPFQKVFPPKIESLPPRSEVRSLVESPLEFQMTWTDLPEFEKRHYADSFNGTGAKKEYQEIQGQIRPAPDIEILDLGDEKLPVRILMDERLKTKGIQAQILRQLIEKGYAALAPEEKQAVRRIFQKTVTGKPLAVGLLERKNDRWPSRRLVSFSSRESFLGLNAYLFESEMEEAVLAAQIFHVLLGPYRRRQKLPPSGGGEGNLTEKVRAWYGRVETKRYNINQELADLFIEAYRDQYGFISNENGDYPTVYKALRGILDRLLIAEGYDPRNFNFHLADYSQSNAYVIRFANHVIVNVGLLSHFMDLIMNYEPDRNFFREFFGRIFVPRSKRVRLKRENLRKFYHEHIAQVLAHEISHLRQYRDQVNEGREPKPETLEEMHKRMQHSVQEIAREEGEKARDRYVNEIDADRYSLAMMERARLSVKEAHMYFQLTYLEMQEEGSGESIFGTHPLLVERVKNIRREIKSKYFGHYDAPLTPFIQPEENFDQSAFYNELHQWSKDGKTLRLKRSRKKEFSHQVLAMKTREDFDRALEDVRDWDDLKFLITVGYFSLLFSAATQKKVFSGMEEKLADWNEKMTAFAQKFRGKRSLGDINTLWEHPEFEGDGIFYTRPVLLEGKLDTPVVDGNPERIPSDVTEDVLSGEFRNRSKDLPVLQNNFLKFWLSSVFVPGKVRFYRQGARYWYQHKELDEWAREFQGYLEEFTGSLGVSDLFQQILPKIESKIQILQAASNTALSPQEVYVKAYIRKFHGKNAWLPPAVASPGSKAQIRAFQERLRRTPRQEFLRLALELIGSRGTEPQSVESEAGVDLKLSFLGQYEGPYGFDRSLSSLIPLMTREGIQAFQEVFIERQADFSLEEALEIFHRLVKQSVIYSMKFEGRGYHTDPNGIAVSSENLKGIPSHHWNTEGLFEVLLTLLERMRAEPALKEAHLQALLDFWKDYPHFLSTDKVHKEDKYFAVGDFFRDFFILNSSNFLRFKPDLQILVGRTGGRIYFTREGIPVERVYTDSVPFGIQGYEVIQPEEKERQPEIRVYDGKKTIQEEEEEEAKTREIDLSEVDEAQAEELKRMGARIKEPQAQFVYIKNEQAFRLNYAILDILDHFAIGRHPLLAPDPADSFMELFDLYAGFITKDTRFEVPEMVRQRYRLLYRVMDRYDLSNAGQRLVFYEHILQKAREREITPLLLTVDRFTLKTGHELIKPLPYFLAEQIRQEQEGHLSILDRPARELIEAKKQRPPETFLDFVSWETDYGVLASYTVDFKEVLRPVPGAVDWFQFSQPLTADEIQDPLLKKVYLDLQSAASVMQNHQRNWVRDKAKQLNLGEEFIGKIETLHPAALQYMYLFGIGGFISYHHFYQALAETFDQWSEWDYEALAIFLNALTPGQQNRRWTPNSIFSARTWEEYLVPVGLFLIRKKFGLPDWDFHRGMREAVDNPFQILFGEVPYHMIQKSGGTVASLHWQVMKAVRKSRTKSTDRYHYPHLRKASLLELWSFIDGHPEVSFENWMEFSRTRLPPSAFRNLFLYHVLWRKEIAPKLHLESKQQESQHYYEWDSRSIRLLRKLAQDHPEFVEAVSRALSLMTRDRTMYQVNQQGASDIIRTMSNAASLYDRREVNHEDIVWGITKMLFAAYLAVWPLSLTSRILALGWAFLILRLVFSGNLTLFGDEPRVIFKERGWRSGLLGWRMGVTLLVGSGIAILWFNIPLATQYGIAALTFYLGLRAFRFTLFLSQAVLWFFASWMISLILKGLVRFAQSPKSVLREVISVLIVWAVHFFSLDKRIHEMADLIRRTTDDPYVMQGAYEGIRKMIYLEYYERLRNYPFIRFWMKLYFKRQRKKEEAVRVPWEFNEPGNIHSQTDVFTGYVFKEALLDRVVPAINFSEALALVRQIKRFFPRKNPVRDEILMKLARTVADPANAMAVPERMKILNRLTGFRRGTSSRKRSWIFQPFFHEEVLLETLNLAIQNEEQKTGRPIAFAKEKKLVLAYFSDFSFTRDDIIWELLERAQDPRDYRDLYQKLVTVQENVTKEDARNKVFVENKVRAYIQSAGNRDKEEFALWLMGLRQTKPFIIQEIEHATLTELNFIRDLLNPRQSPAFKRYPTVGQSLKADMVETLFGGQNGLILDRRVFFHFLNAVFEQKVPRKLKNRDGVKRAYFSIFRRIDDEKKIEILKAMANVLTPNQETDVGILVQAFFRAMGLIGIKMAQYLVHSDIELDPRIESALETLSSSADVYGKKYVHQFMGLVFPEDFRNYFEAIQDQEGSASIKFVYGLLLAMMYARLNGIPLHVVLKLKRPEIDKVVEDELSALEAVLGDLSSWEISWRRIRKPIKMPEDIAAYIREIIYEEVDFLLERENRKHFTQLQQKRQQRRDPADPRFLIGNRRVIFLSPEGISDLDALLPTALRNQAMFEVKVEGYKLKELEGAGNPLGLTAEGLRRLKRIIFEDLMEQIFRDGLFHADPHGGNIWVHLAENGRDVEVIYLDLGSMGRTELAASREEMERIFGPVASVESLQVNGKPLIEYTHLHDPDKWVINPSLTLEDFAQPTGLSEYQKRFLTALWLSKQTTKREKVRELASWLLHMALYKGSKPSLSSENFLEARFFKEIWYVMRDIPPLEVAGMIFKMLAVPFPEGQAEQIRAVRMMAQGNQWAALEEQDYQATFWDRVLSVGFSVQQFLRRRPSEGRDFQTIDENRSQENRSELRRHEEIRRDPDTNRDIRNLFVRLRNQGMKVLAREPRFREEIRNLIQHWEDQGLLEEKGEAAAIADRIWESAFSEALAADYAEGEAVEERLDLSESDFQVFSDTVLSAVQAMSTAQGEKKMDVVAVLPERENDRMILMESFSSYRDYLRRVYLGYFSPAGLGRSTAAALKMAAFRLPKNQDRQAERLNQIQGLLDPNQIFGFLIQQAGLNEEAFRDRFTSVETSFQQIPENYGTRLKKAMVFSGLALLYALSLLEKDERDLLLSEAGRFQTFIESHPQLYFMKDLWGVGGKSFVPASLETWLETLKTLQILSAAA